MLEFDFYFRMCLLSSLVFIFIHPVENKGIQTVNSKLSHELDKMRIEIMNKK